MKKVLSLFLVLCMCLSIPTVSFADNAKDVVSKAKNISRKSNFASGKAIRLYSLVINLLSRNIHN